VRLLLPIFVLFWPVNALAQTTEEMTQRGIELVSAIQDGKIDYITDLNIKVINSTVDAQGELQSNDQKSYARPFKLGGGDLSNLLRNCELRRFESDSSQITSLWLCAESSNWRTAAQSRDGNNRCYDKAYSLILSYGFVDVDGAVEPKMLLNHRNFWNSERCKDRVQQVILAPRPQVNK